MFERTGTTGEAIAVAVSNHLRAKAEQRKNAEIQKAIHEAGRNDPCPCGSGIHFDKCCGRVQPPTGVMTFPNDTCGYVRVEKKERETKPLSPDERFARLAAAFTGLHKLQPRGRKKVCQKTRVRRKIAGSLIDFGPRRHRRIVGVKVTTERKPASNTPVFDRLVANLTAA